MIVFGGVFFLIFFKQFTTLPWDFLPYAIIAIWLVGAIIFYILTIKMNYYILHKKYVIFRKYGKDLIYNFSEVLYIDEEQSLKKKTIIFVTTKGHTRYMIFDRKNVLYSVMLQKCTNRISKEELLQRFPNIDL
jgi:hypothetical protein